MTQFVLFLHVLGAILMGIYLMMPFLAARIGGLQGQARTGFLSLLYTANRVGQFVLVIEFLTGGYLVSKGNYAVSWMITAVVLFLALGAFTGILGKQLRLGLSDESGKSIAGQLGKIRLFSNLTGIVFLLIIFIMKYYNLFG